MANLVLYNSFHTANVEGWYYVYTPAKQYQNWKYDGPTFYAYPTQEPGTVPIYQDSATGTPLRFRLTADQAPGQGWRYSYTTEGLWGILWRYAGIDFYAPTPDNHTYPPYDFPPLCREAAGTGRVPARLGD